MLVSVTESSCDMMIVMAGSAIVSVLVTEYLCPFETWLMWHSDCLLQGQQIYDSFHVPGGHLLGGRIYSTDPVLWGCDMCQPSLRPCETM